ncbi:MAG: class GN sortase [Sphingomonas sp.]
MGVALTLPSLRSSLPLPKGEGKGRKLAYAALLALCLAGAVQIAAGAVIPAKALVAQMLLERAFDRSLATGRAQKPWSWADMAPVARLSVPRLSETRIVLDTGSGQAMAFGPTLLPGGARLGATGTTVIAAHRDTHFAFLKDVRVGDVVQVEGIDGVTHSYRVTGSEIVRWDRFALPGGEGRELALATCYPFEALGHGPLRYVVHAVDIAATPPGR